MKEMAQLTYYTNLVEMLYRVYFHLQRSINEFILK